MCHQMAIMVGLGLLFGLSGCTLVEKYEQYVENKQHQWCMSANWYDVGQSDGPMGKAKMPLVNMWGNVANLALAPVNSFGNKAEKLVSPRNIVLRSKCVILPKEKLSLIMRFVHLIKDSA